MWLFQYIPLINKHMDLIPYFKKLLKQAKSSNHGKSFCICVKPKDQANDGTFVSSLTFKIYLYDSSRSKQDKWLKTSIPEWVLANSKRGKMELSVLVLFNQFNIYILNLFTKYFNH